MKYQDGYNKEFDKKRHKNELFSSNFFNAIYESGFQIITLKNSQLKAIIILINIKYYKCKKF